MRLFGPIHLILLAATAVIAALLTLLCRRMPASRRYVRLFVGWALIVNELIWWRFRYAREGVHVANLPLQLCDLTVWSAALACLTLAPVIVELAYFAGIAGAGMALLTPDLWSPWPSYPAVYFFLAHGGIVIAAIVLVYGHISPLRNGAMLRAYGLLLGYACLVGAFDKIYGANYMYLCRKPHNASLLDSLGGWPWYLAAAAVVALALFALLWIPARPRRRFAPVGRPVGLPH